MRLTILGAPVTKSNHQKIIQVRGRPMVIQSAPYRKWEKSALEQLRLATHGIGVYAPAKTPISLKATFYRERRTGDLGNYLKALCDVLERAGLVENDRLIESFDGSRLSWDKNNPRVEFEVTPMPIDEIVEFTEADWNAAAKMASDLSPLARKPCPRWCGWEHPGHVNDPHPLPGQSFFLVKGEDDVQRARCANETHDFNPRPLPKPLSPLARRLKRRGAV